MTNKVAATNDFIHNPYLWGSLCLIVLLASIFNRGTGLSVVLWFVSAGLLEHTIRVARPGVVGWSRIWLFSLATGIYMLITGWILFVLLNPVA